MHTGTYSGRTVVYAANIQTDMFPFSLGIMQNGQNMATFDLPLIPLETISFVSALSKQTRA
jgi:hypothetical protein